MPKYILDVIFEKEDNSNVATCEILDAQEQHSE